MSPVEVLRRFCHRLIDQEAAKPIILPMENSSGFWFGGGNMEIDGDGNLFVVGRYRNAGDSRTGVASGTRGLELAIFKSADQGQSFHKIASWGKAELNTAEAEVLSIEGSCLRFHDAGAELYVSTEKIGIPYPDELSGYLKPGAGVWTIDVLQASSVDTLTGGRAVPFLRSNDPEHLHVKDPFFWHGKSQTRLGFCSHPYSWSSSNTCVTDLQLNHSHSATSPQTDFGVIPRGTTWDVAMTRGTCILPLPRVGRFSDHATSLLFYCGGECLRPHDEHATAVMRPRGYSCEEIGGAGFIVNDDPGTFTRLSRLAPMFVSPYGTGCSRYVDVLSAPEGYYATWQQSQKDLSQPLVMNFLPRDEAEALLAE
ncbi:MAG: hypothetical protein R3C20_16630 [Planctomycetaceae bacterium]